MKKVVVIILSVVVLLTVGVVLFKYYKHNQARKSAEKTVIAFIEVSNEQDINEMLKYIEPTEAQIISFGISKFDDVTNSSAFTKLKKWMPYVSDFTNLQFIPQFDVSINNCDLNDNNADVTATLTNQKNKSQIECVFRLIKIENKWYLQYVTEN